MSFAAADVPDQTGRTFMVTGANSGIGYEAALVLAGKGARVLLACRDKARADTAMQAIRQQHPQASLAFVPLDLGNFASVRAAAAQVESLDVLVNNAGVMRPPLGYTRDGFELQFGINHLGHFALTGLLLGTLALGSSPRVVTVASIAHKRGDIDFANLDGAQGYSRSVFYSQSKLANLLFMAELDRRLRASGSPIKSVACHPGISGTELGRASKIEYYAMKAASLIFHAPERAALPTLMAATGPGVEGGDYYGPQGWLEASGAVGHARRTDRARDPECARRLWDLSVDLTGVDPGLPSA